jgi:hypothetical protein
VRDPPGGEGAGLGLTRLGGKPARRRPRPGNSAPPAFEERGLGRSPRQPGRDGTALRGGGGEKGPVAPVRVPRRARHPRGRSSPSTRSFSAGNCSRVAADLRGSNSTGEDLLARARLREDLAPGIDHDRVTGLGNSGVRTGRSTSKDERLVLDRAGPSQQRPVGAAALGPARREDEGLGAGVDETAEELGESGGRSRWRDRRPSRAAGPSPVRCPRPSARPRPCRSRSGGSCGRRRPVHRRGRRRGRCCRGAPQDPARGSSPRAATRPRRSPPWPSPRTWALRAAPPPRRTLVGERPRRPQLRQDDQIGTGLLAYEGRHTPRRDSTDSPSSTAIWRERRAHYHRPGIRAVHTGLRSSHESTAGVPHSSVT